MFLASNLHWNTDIECIFPAYPARTEEVQSTRLYFYLTPPEH